MDAPEPFFFFLKEFVEVVLLYGSFVVLAWVCDDIQLFAAILTFLVSLMSRILRLVRHTLVLLFLVSGTIFFLEQLSRTDIPAWLKSSIIDQLMAHTGTAELRARLMA